MGTSNSLVIETRNLNKAYKGVQALQGLNLAVKQHSIFGFLGPNGAGKSTTIKIAMIVGLGMPMPAMAVSGIIVTVVASIVFILAALWRFQHTEL